MRTLGTKAFACFTRCRCRYFGNSLRALVKHLDGISDSEIAELNIPTGIPLVYELDSSLKPINVGGKYLDPQAAVNAAAAVANQGKH